MLLSGRCYPGTIAGVQGQKEYCRIQLGMSGFLNVRKEKLQKMENQKNTISMNFGVKS